MNHASPDSVTPFNFICMLNFFSYHNSCSVKTGAFEVFLHLCSSPAPPPPLPANLQTLTYIALPFTPTYGTPVGYHHAIVPPAGSVSSLCIAFSLYFCLYLMVDSKWDPCWGLGISFFFSQLASPLCSLMCSHLHFLIPEHRSPKHLEGMHQAFRHYL